MLSKNGFTFTADDLELLQYVFELRLAIIEYLAALVDRSYTRVHKRLAKMAAHGYLSLVRGRPGKHVYGLGRQGIAALIEGGHAPAELASRRLRDNELKPLGIAHSIFVANIHTRILLLTRAGAMRLTNWEEGPHLWDRVTTSGGLVLPVRPDAHFQLQNPAWPEGKQRVNCMLEADRGTMSLSRMRDKVTAYMHYFSQRRHTEKFKGMKAFRVVTVAETRGRAASLAADFKTLMPETWWRAYPVVAFEDLTLETIVPELRDRNRMTGEPKHVIQTTAALAPAATGGAQALPRIAIPGSGTD
jgi:hypothetical protein